MMGTNDGVQVLLFSQRAPTGTYAYWWKEIDALVIEPKGESSRADRISDFLDLHYASHEDKVVGFKLWNISPAISQLAQMHGWQSRRRVAVVDILNHYRGICLGADWKRGFAERERVQASLRDLVRMCWHTTILQPEHARTLSL